MSLKERNILVLVRKGVSVCERENEREIGERKRGK